MIQRSGATAVRALVFVVAAGSQAGAAEPEAPVSFSIAEYRVLGNSVLPGRDIETLLYPRLGDGKTIADVEAARLALETLYRERGYGTVFVDIPEQEVANGIVRLKTTEGRLDRVRVTGARYFSQGRIREQLPALTPGAVPRLPELQEQLADVNRQSRDRAVTPVLRSGRNPGTVDMDIRVEDDLPLHASVTVNDRYTANTSRTRASLNVGYENLFQRFHSLSFQYQTSPEATDETRVLALTYLAPLAGSGDMVAVYAVDTNSDFAAISAGGDLSVLGAGRIYGARYIFRLPGSQGFSQSLTLGADYKDFADNIRLTDGVTDTTPIEYLAWSVAYGGVLSSERHSTGFNLALTGGFRGLVNDQREFDFKRYNAGANFLSLRADANHLRTFSGGWGAYGRIAGQWSGDPLISNEQFALGGADTVRGYLESTQLGDLGLVGGIELRAPSLHGWLGPVRQLVPFVFVDAGIVSILDWIDSVESPPDANGNTTFRNVVRSSRSFSLAGAGAGLRLAGPGGLDAALDWAYPLRAAGDTAEGDSRVHFQVSYGF